MDSNNGNNAKKAMAAFVVILAVVMVTVGVNASNSKQQPADNTTTPRTAANTATPHENTTPTQTTEAPATNSPSNDIKDGTYTASSEYYVPHGYEDISVTLTIKDGVITTSQITNSEDNPESTRYQQRFTSSYKSYVVGKKASGLKLPYVAGASDTTDGFNDALEKILVQAQV